MIHATKKVVPPHTWPIVLYVLGLFAVAALVLSSVGCASVYRSFGVAPTSDVEAVREETKTLVETTATEMATAIEGEQSLPVALGKVARAMDRADADWANRPDEAPTAWVEIIAGLLGLGGATAVATKKWVDVSRDKKRMARGEPVEAPKRTARTNKLWQVDPSKVGGVERAELVKPESSPS